MNQDEEHLRLLSIFHYVVGGVDSSQFMVRSSWFLESNWGIFRFHIFQRDLSDGC
jgi:hypothetical protein